MGDDRGEAGRADVEGHRRFEDQSRAFHSRVRRGYLEQAKTGDGWRTMDARLPVDEPWPGLSGKRSEPLLPARDADQAALITALL